MKVFISYSQKDKKYADLIAKRVKEAGHLVWFDAWTLRAGDNLINKITEGLKEVDALIIIVSEHSLRSKWVLTEYSAIAMGDISGTKTRIIPALVDNSTVPEYLARYLYVDLQNDIENGLNSIINALKEDAKEPEKPRPERKSTYDKSISVLNQELRAGRLTLVCGAGVSIDAGIPSWNSLLLKLLESMMIKISQNFAMKFSNNDANEFHKRYGPSALIIGKYLKTNLGNDFLPQLRDALYANNPTNCDIINAIVELSRPQREGKPIDSIITFNFDGLIEENLEKNNICYKAISTEGMRTSASELPIYHVHGYLPRKGKIRKEDEIVFSEDAYHSQFIDSFSWSNLIQLNKLSQNTCLFVGLSLTDPNLRRLLDVAKRKNPSRVLSHFLIKKAPNFSNSSDTVDELAFLLEEQDANELGLNVIWVKEFTEIPLLIKKLADYKP
jgi:hypothetical protein